MIFLFFFLISFSFSIIFIFFPDFNHKVDLPQELLEYLLASFSLIDLKIFFFSKKKTDDDDNDSLE
jgi:hypothetical protein